MIGIIGAMEKEVNILIEQLQDYRTQKINTFTFHQGTLDGREIVVLISGIGKVNSAMATQMMIIKYNPEMIINFGICGCLDPNVTVGDLLLVSRVVQFDIDTTAVGDLPGLIPGLNQVYLQPNADALQKANEIGRDNQINIIEKVLGTSDKFIVDYQDIYPLIDQYQISIVDMEGGAIAQVCQVNQVDWLLVKTISDRVGVDDVESYLVNSIKVVNNITLYIKKLVGGL